jgi:competence protein ComEC
VTAPSDSLLIFLDVGQGHCFLGVDGPTRNALVIDCPTGGGKLALERLTHHRATLQTAIISHLDLDHLGGMVELLDLVLPQYLVYNNDRPLPEDVNERRKLTAILRALAGFEDVGVDLDHATTGGGVAHVGSTLTWVILAPSKGELTRAYADRKPNRASALIRVEASGFVALVPGDADAVAWDAILNRLDSDALRADAMLIPHHGARLEVSETQATLRRVLKTVGAAYHVVSVGFGNTYEHPDPGVLEEVARRSEARLICTQINSTCLHKAEFAAVRAAGACLPASSDGAGQRGRRCACGGTVVFAISPERHVSVSPSSTDHQHVINALGNPRCRLAVA